MPIPRIVQANMISNLLCISVTSAFLARRTSPIAELRKLHKPLQSESQRRLGRKKPPKICYRPKQPLNRQLGRYPHRDTPIVKHR